MISEGFIISVWDWDGFKSIKNIMDNPACIKAITDAQKDYDFDKYERRMRAYLDEAIEMSKDNNVKSWCSP